MFEGVRGSGEREGAVRSPGPKPPSERLTAAPRSQPASGASPPGGAQWRQPVRVRRWEVWEGVQRWQFPPRGQSEGGAVLVEAACESERVGGEGGEEERRRSVRGIGGTGRAQPARREVCMTFKYGMHPPGSYLASGLIELRSRGVA